MTVQTGVGVAGIADSDKTRARPKSTCQSTHCKIMESVVAPQITAELTQILSNLVLGDNEIRAKYLFIFFRSSYSFKLCCN
jgi:hypothetical protein